MAFGYETQTEHQHFICFLGIAEQRNEAFGHFHETSPKTWTVAEERHQLDKWPYTQMSLQSYNSRTRRGLPELQLLFKTLSTTPTESVHLWCWYSSTDHSNSSETNKSKHSSPANEVTQPVLKTSCKRTHLDRSLPSGLAALDLSSEKTGDINNREHGNDEETLSCWLCYGEGRIRRPNYYYVGRNCSEPDNWTCGAS